MPLFEYICTSCDRQFEALVRARETVACPGCQGTSLERRLSTFAARTNGSPGSSAPVAGPCGACGDPRGPGACSLN